MVKFVLILFHCSFKMGLDQTHIRHCMLYWFKRGSSAIEVLRNICFVYGDETLSVQICQWLFGWILFWGHFSLTNSPQSGWPNSVSVQILIIVTEEIPKQTAWELTKQFNSSHISKYLQELSRIESTLCSCWSNQQFYWARLLNRVVFLEQTIHK